METLIDKRVNRRIYFSKDLEVTAECEMPGPVVLIYDFTVMDLSIGGMGVVIERDCLGGIIKGSRLTVKNFSGFGPMGRIGEMEVEVMWVLDYQPLAYVGVGCRFVHVTPGQMEVLSHLTGRENDAEN